MLVPVMDCARLYHASCYWVPTNRQPAPVLHRLIYNTQGIQRTCERTCCWMQRRSSDYQRLTTKSYIPLLFSCNGLPIITFPPGAGHLGNSSGQREQPPYWGLTPPSPRPWRKVQSVSCVCRTETWVTPLYIIIFSHCHTTSTHTQTDTHTEPSSRGASFSPLTFSKPLGPWRDTQTTHCTETPVSFAVNINTQIQLGDIHIRAVRQCV